MLTDRQRAKARAQAHFDECEKRALHIGIDSLKIMIYLMPLNRNYLVELLLQSHDLAQIADEKWLEQHRAVQTLAADGGYPLWSQTWTIDVLRHVAIYHIVGSGVNRRTIARSSEK